MLRRSGEIRCTGRNDEGQLGLGNRIHRNTLATVPDLAPVHQMGSGNGRSNAIVTTNNDVFVWGMNDQGNLGLGHLITPVLEPTAVPGF